MHFWSKALMHHLNNTKYRDWYCGVDDVVQAYYAGSGLSSVCSTFDQLSALFLGSQQRTFQIFVLLTSTWEKWLMPQAADIGFSQPWSSRVIIWWILEWIIKSKIFALFSWRINWLNPTNSSAYLHTVRREDL